VRQAENCGGTILLKILPRCAQSVASSRDWFRILLHPKFHWQHFSNDGSAVIYSVITQPALHRIELPLPRI
jgi:hypothetical protein